jgi:hypothetical protein
MNPPFHGNEDENVVMDVNGCAEDETQLTIGSLTSNNEESNAIPLGNSR